MKSLYSCSLLWSFYMRLYLGTMPSESPAIMSASLFDHFTKGAGYPVGGAGEIALNIIPVIEEAGGRVLVRANGSYTSWITQNTKICPNCAQSAKYMYINSCVCCSKTSHVFEYISHNHIISFKICKACALRYLLDIQSLQQK